MAAKGDLNKIPYDAPLSIQEPSVQWVRWQTRKGDDTSTITKAQVPGADLTGKWIVITGSNSGVGREAALQFASWGANLILACRKPPPNKAHEMHPELVVEEVKQRHKENSHTQAEVEWWEIDMAKLATVESLAQRWLATGRPLDILCNNAGIGSNPGGDKVFKTEDGFEIVHQVSVHATASPVLSDPRRISSHTFSSRFPSSPPSKKPSSRGWCARHPAFTTLASSISKASKGTPAWRSWECNSTRTTNCGIKSG